MLEKERLLFSIGTMRAAPRVAMNEMSCLAGLCFCLCHTCAFNTQSTVVSMNKEEGRHFNFASSAGYVGSIGGTLYASTVMHSYILSLVMCAIQVITTTSCLIALRPTADVGKMGRWYSHTAHLHTQVFARAQVSALFFYVATNFPGGTAGARYVMSSIFGMASGMLSGVRSAIFR